MFDVEDPRFNSDETAPPATGLPGEPERRGRGCLFWGCLISGVMLLLLIVGGALVVYFAARYYLREFTTDQAADLEVAPLPEARLAELSARLAAFSEAVEAGGVPPDLELTAEEINGLIAEDEELRGRVFVRIEDGRLGGDVILPADPFPGGEGRFLKIAAECRVAMRDGVLDIRLESAQLGGVATPQWVIDSLADKNLAADAKFDNETKEFLAKFESLEVVGDRLVLKAKRLAPDEPAPQPPGEAAEPAGVGVGVE